MVLSQIGSWKLEVRGWTSTPRYCELFQHLASSIQLLIPLVVSVAALFIVGCQPSDLGTEWHRIDPPAPSIDFTLPQLDGTPVHLAELQGRVVIMEFWATWCGPCRYSSPSLDAIYRQYKNRGVSVLLINEGESAEHVRRWAEHRFAAPTLLDQETQVSARYNVHGLPSLFILDRSGQIIYAHAGYGGGLERRLQLILDQELGSAERHG